MTSEYFVKKLSCKNGIERTCRNCRKKQRKEYNEIFKDEIAVKCRKYYENNKERIAQRNKQYKALNIARVAEWKRRHHEANNEQIAEYHKIYYLNHKDEIAERVKRYNALNRDKRSIWEHKRAATKRRLPSTLTNDQWEDIKLYFDNKCAYCGDEKTLTKEHFLAINNGGEFTKDNIIPSCLSCNCSKQDKLFRDWYPSFKYYSENREAKILNYLNYKQGVQQLSIL